MRIITPLPTDCYLALSGGSDSMFAYHFLRGSGRKVTPLFFHHGTESSSKASKFLLDQHIPHIVGMIGRVDTKLNEQELRQERYSFFDRFKDKPIVTAHHLDDQIETWLMASMFGKQRLIPYRRDNFIRPFLHVRKSEIRQYLVRNDIKWCEDLSNLDESIPRNRVRHSIVKHALAVNPGLYKTVSKLMDC